MAGRDFSAELFGSTEGAGRDFSAELFGEEKKGKKSTIGSELVRGGKQLASSIQTGAEALFGTPEEAALAGIERGRKISKEAGEGVSLEAVKRAYEKEGLLSAAGEVVGQIPRALAGQGAQLAAMAAAAKAGAMAGTAVAPGVGTVIGGALGAGASLLPQFLGANVERQVQEQIEAGQAPKVDLGRAGAAAAGQAAIEGAGTAFVLGKRVVKGFLGIADDAALATNRARQEMVKAAERTMLQAAGRGAVRGGAEIPVEVAQQILERAQAGLDVTSPEALSEYGEAAYQAALVGGPLGAVSGPIDTGMARQARARIEQANAEREKQKAIQEQQAEQQRLAAERAAEEAKPPLMLGVSEPFAPVVFPDGSVATTPEDVVRYEEEQFRKKYAPQKAQEPEREVLALSDEGVFRPVPLPDGSVAMTREDLAAYEEEQFRKKYAPQAVKQEEPIGQSITGTDRAALLEAEDPLASAIRARREEQEAKAEIPASGTWEFLFLQRERLISEPKTKERDAMIKRLDDEIMRLGVQDFERRRRDAEAAKTSVFAQEQLPPVESRAEVVGREELAAAQAREAVPEVPLTKKEVTAIEKMQGQPAPAESDADQKIAKLEAQRKSIKSPSLYGLLIGKLNPSEVRDISPDIGNNLRKKGGGGTFISDMVSSGILDDYLPPNMRRGSLTFDEQESTELIKDKLRNKDNLTFDASMQARQLDDQINQLRKEADGPRRAEYEISDVEPGEAASIERAATDAGELEGLRYQRATTEGRSIGKEQTQSVVDAVKSQWANAPEVVVAENMDDPAIPAEVRAHNKAAMQKGAKGSPRGFFYKGKAYVLADAATSPTQVIETLFHESLGHYGLRGTFGPEMESVLRNVVKNRRADVEAKAEQYGLDPKSESDMLEAAEEVLAEIAQTKPGLSFVKRAIAVIRNFLRDLGLPFKMSNDDIIQKYILPARAFVEKGGSKAVEGKPAAAREGVRYQREGEPEEAGKTKPTRRNIAGEPILGRWVIQADPQMEIKDGLIYKFLDKNVDIKRIVQTIEEKAGEIAAQWNPYLKEELYHGRVAKATEEFRDKEWQPLLDEMKAMDVQVGELEQYLLNRHAEEYNKHIAKVNPTRPEMQDGGSSVTTEKARKYLADLPDDKKAKYEALAKRVDKITKGTRNLLVETGYEKPETIKAWEETFPHYVPLFREEGDFDYNFGSFGTGSGFDVRRSFSRSAMGSKRQVVDIIANVIGARHNAIILTEKNRVAQAVYGLALKSPNPDFWLAINPDAEKQPADVIDELKRMGLDEDALKNLAMEPRQRALDPKKNEVISRINSKLRDNKHVLATRINGERRYVFFNPKDERSKRAATALKNLDAEDLGMALGFISSITRWMAAVNTQYNPIFGPYNFLRDVQAAALQLSTTPLAGQQKEISKYIVPSLKTIYSSLRKRRKGEEVDTELGKLWQEFQKEGGQTGFKDVFSRTQDRQQALVNELTRMSEGKLKGGFREVGNWLSDYNDSLENAVRLSAYKVAKEKFLKEGKSVDEAKQRAASLAKNLTVNFNRKGQVATQMGALYAFFNASMQGTARLYETLKGPMGKKIIGGGLLLGAMQAALLALAGYDDEEPPEFVRERNLIIPLDFFGVDDKYLAFPMPLGFHVIPGISRILTEWTLSGFKDTPERVASLTGLFLEAFNPIGNAGWSLQTATPTFLDPFIALAENKDWTGKPIYKEDLFALRPTPGYTRAKEATNVVYKSIAEFLNLASGGTKYQKGMFSPTPEQIEYLVGQAFGGVGREISKIATTAEKLSTGEELPPYKVPLLGRFYGETKSSAAESSRFYKNMERLNKLNAEIKGRRDNREPLGDFMRENPEARLAPMAEKTYKDIQQLRKRREQLVERDAPRESVKAVEEQIKRRMAVFNERVARFSE